ncbi:MAG: AMP-binding protein [Planctomycetes bacterium]|nr:AMP-binding protein [Planctomycetota bacterium]
MTEGITLREPNVGLWLQRVAREYGDRECLRRRTSKDHSPVSYRELYEFVRQAGAGFADLGVRSGDRVGLISDNRREWLVVDLALGAMGAVDVPRGGDTANLEIITILSHSGSRGAVVESVERARALAEAISQMPGLDFLVLLEGDPKRIGRLEHLRVLSFDELLDRGKARLARGEDDLARLGPTVPSDALLTLVYTSGTTGVPKGVQLTHGNVLSNVTGVRDLIPVAPGEVALSILPTWHMFERLIEYVVLDKGATLVYTDPRRLRGDFQSEKPQLIGTVPRVWEGLNEGITDKVAKAPPMRRRLFETAKALSLAHVRARARGSSLAALAVAPLAWLARKVVFDPLREKAGLDRLKVAVSGGGSLPFALDEFLQALGVPILNGYGLTETSPVIAVRRHWANRPGPVGAPIPGTDVKLVTLEGATAKPGEVGVLRVRGPQVTKGYYRDAEQTAKAFPEDGWFDTGDLARIDERGEIWIVGRAKDTIALRGGEKIEPERVETALKASPLIAQAVVVGQDAKQLGVILVPNLERLAEVTSKAVADGAGDWIEDEAARKALRAEIDRLVSSSAGYRPYERPVRIAILRKPLDVQNGLLTATLKVKRRAVVERYGAVITKLLAD